MSPENVVALAERVVHLAERARGLLKAGEVDAAEALADATLEAADSLRLPLGRSIHRQVVVSLHRLANSLSDVRSASRALQVARRAVEVARSGAVNRQADEGDLLPLALTGLANRQWAAGEREASVLSGAEAAWLSAALDSERDAVGGAAWASLGLANHLVDLGRYDEALAHAAVGISANRWLLARQDPSAMEELILCLNARGRCLAVSGRHREALGSYSEAADLLKRCLAELAEQPSESRRDLLMVLGNASDAALKVGDVGQAKTLLEDAVGWCQRFCDSDPSFEPLLLDIVNRLWRIG